MASDSDIRNADAAGFPRRNPDEERQAEAARVHRDSVPARSAPAEAVPEDPFASNPYAAPISAATMQRRKQRLRWLFVLRIYLATILAGGIFGALQLGVAGFIFGVFIAGIVGAPIHLLAFVAALITDPENDSPSAAGSTGLLCGGATGAVSGLLLVGTYVYTIENIMIVAAATILGGLISGVTAWVTCPAYRRQKARSRRMKTDDR